MNSLDELQFSLISKVILFVEEKEWNKKNASFDEQSLLNQETNLHWNRKNS